MLVASQVLQMIFWDTSSIHNVVGRDLVQKKFVIAEEIDPKHVECLDFFE